MKEKKEGTAAASAWCAGRRSQRPQSVANTTRKWSCSLECCMGASVYFQLVIFAGCLRCSVACEWETLHWEFCWLTSYRLILSPLWLCTFLHEIVELDTCRGWMKKKKQQDALMYNLYISKKSSALPPDIRKRTGITGVHKLLLLQSLPYLRPILINVKWGSNQRRRNRTSRLRGCADTQKTSFLIFHCFTRSHAAALKIYATFGKETNQQSLIKC